MRSRTARQRDATRAPVLGQRVVHVVRQRAHGGDLPETGLGAVPAAVPVAVRVRGPIGGAASGAGRRGAGRVQPRVHGRRRPVRVAEERVLLRPRRSPEPDVRVHVRSRGPGREGAYHADADARARRAGRDVRYADGRAHRPAVVRASRQGRGH